MTSTRLIFILGALAMAAPLSAQPPAGAALPALSADPADVGTPEDLLTAAYESIQRAPGEPFDWERFRSLFLPTATLIPNVEQTDGELRLMTVDDFISWVDRWTAENAPIGSEADEGLQEEEIHHTIHRYGDIAQVMSTYQKRVWGGDEILAQGINSFQLLHHGQRWWIVSIVWDEDYAAGPIPPEYLP